MNRFLNFRSLRKTSPRPVSREIHGAVLLALAVTAGGLVILAPPPPAFSQMLLTAPVGLVIGLIVLFALLFRPSGTLADAGGLVLTVVLFCLPLVAKWQTGHYDGSVIGGLFPFSDASGYFHDAQRLIFGSSFSTFSTRRPLFAGLLAVSLSIFQGKLQATLVFFTVLNGVAAFFAAREVKNTHGASAAGIVLVLEFLYFRMHTGRMTTESLGFAMGALGLALLWRGARQNRMRLLWFGLFTLALGLNARAGALLILPVIILWGEWVYWKEPRLRYRWMAGAVGAVVGAFLINLIIVKMIGAPTGGAFSNYWFTVYGLAAGNKGWTQVMIDHPGIAESQVQAAAIQKVLAQPGMFIVGSWRALIDYFSPSMGAFSFLFLNSGWNRFANLFLWGATIFGMIVSVRRIRERLASLQLALFLGILLSVFLVPPLDSNAMRAYAATIPVTALTVVSALLFLRPKPLEGQPSSNPEGSICSGIAVAASLILILMTTVGPVYIKLTGRAPENLSVQACPSGQEWISMSIVPGVIVNIISDQDQAASYLPDIRQSDIISSVNQHGGNYPELDKAIAGLQPGQSLVYGIDRSDLQKYGEWSNNIYLIGRTSQIKPGLLETCAIPTPNPWLKAYRFMSLEEPKDVPAVLSKPASTPSGAALPFYVWVGAVLVILLGTVLDTAHFWSRPALFKWVEIISLMACVPLVAIIFQREAIFPIRWETRSLSTEDAQFIDGHMYRIPLNTNWMSQSRVGHSPAILLENGTRLMGGNAARSVLIEKGSGSYALEDGSLYFSSSDNTDPQTNQREYAILWPKPFRKNEQVLALGLWALGILGLIASQFPQPVSSAAHFFWRSLRRFTLLILKKFREWSTQSHRDILGFIEAVGGLLIFYAILSQQLGIEARVLPDWARGVLLVLGVVIVISPVFKRKIH